MAKGSYDRYQEYCDKADAEAKEVYTAGNDKAKKQLAVSTVMMWMAMADHELKLIEADRAERRQRINSERLSRVEGQLGILAAPESPRLPGWLSDGDTESDDQPAVGF